MKKLLVLAAMALSSLSAHPYDLLKNGIYYNLISKGNVATVTYGDWTPYNPTNNDGRYSGIIIIPEKIEIDGVPYNVKHIGESAFTYCEGLTSVTIPMSVTTIEDHAFQSCRNLSSITIPEGVTSIGDFTFSGCLLTSISIPNSITSIGDAAFQDCSLTSVTIPNNVNSIGEYVFENCKKLSSVILPENLKIIPKCTFVGCSGLTSFIIPDSIISVEERAFAGCTELTSVYIPKRVARIGNNAFGGCAKMEKVNISDLSAWCNINFETGYLGSNNRWTSNPLSVAHHLYINGEEVKNLIIPDNLSKIKKDAFYGCTGITTLIIPEGVQSIEEYAFYSCEKLKTVYIPDGITYLRNNSFANCKDLSDVFCYSKELPIAYNSTYQDSYIEYATLHVPASSLEKYKETAPWSGFGSIVPIEGDEPGMKVCAKPTISYVNGTLTFSCETEGVEFVSEITDTDIKKHYEASVSLTATYNISVYATKTGYDNSEVATATLCWIDVAPQTEGLTDEDAVTEVKALPVLIQTQGSTITIQGVADGTEVSVYDTNGMLQASTIADKGIVTLNTTLPPGSVAIVKISEKSVKVMIK